ncbi:MAG: N-formylglutamate amidohydrolase [Nannocystaceae bacterium]
MSDRHDAWEQLRGPAKRADLLLTCEHASLRLPAPWSWPAEDQWLIDTHWSHDIGAAELTRELADSLACDAILSRFTRLLVDPNRAREQDGLFRTEAEGRAIELNGNLSAEEQELRLRGYYQAYHDAISARIQEAQPTCLVSVHSFTPVYQQQQRTMEVGVLFDHDRELAERVGNHLAGAYKVTYNEPYTAVNGTYAFSAWHHGGVHKIPWIELEVRQDICGDPTARARLVPRLAAALQFGFGLE